MKAPIAKQIPHKLEKHQDIRIDPYFWLKERKNPEVIEYINQENSYAEESLKHTKEFQEKLYQEMKARIKEDNSTVPYLIDNYYYYTRFEMGKEYAIYCRKKESIENPEEILLDLNGIGDEHSFCQISSFEVSPDHNQLAYSLDTVGRRIYTIYIKDLKTGQLHEETIPEAAGELAWANDNETLFYAKQDLDTLRSHQIYRYNLRSKKKELVYSESDETFYISIHKTRSQKFLLIPCASTLSTEYYYLDANHPEKEFLLFQEREANHEYFLDHGDEDFYIRTNNQAKNFRLMKTPTNQTKKKNWVEVIPHREDVLLDEINIFQHHIVLQEFTDGLTQIHLIHRETKKENFVRFDGETYDTYIGKNPNYHSKWLRYNFESLTIPSSIYDYNFETGEQILKKQQPVLGGFDSNDYHSERIFATSEDGTKIPISLVHRKNIEKDGQNPLLLEGYGSYGINMTTSFSSNRLSLLNRGFIYAIPHIRGSSRMGRYWYEDGKLLKKKNTFKDFITCSEYLIQQKYTSSEHLYAWGGSAGGLLMGAILNMRPDLYNGVIAEVPFFDVVTTMLDSSIPLTTSEYDEWGNPNDEEYYRYMLSYSPYDNLTTQNYPNILVNTGFHDSQVQYWEPAKWTAKLRSLKKDQNILLLKTNMNAGHGGASGRFERLKEVALNYAFMLDLENNLQ